jgi:hypothetical protein
MYTYIYAYIDFYCTYIYTSMFLVCIYIHINQKNIYLYNIGVISFTPGEILDPYMYVYKHMYIDILYIHINIFQYRGDIIHTW